MAASSGPACGASAVCHFAGGHAGASAARQPRRRPAAAQDVLLLAWQRVSTDAHDLAGAAMPETVAAQWRQLMQDTHRLQAQFNDAVTRYNVAIAQFRRCCWPGCSASRQRARYKLIAINWLACGVAHGYYGASGPAGPTIGAGNAYPKRRSR